MGAFINFLVCERPSCNLVVTRITQCKFMNAPSDAVICRHFWCARWTFLHGLDVEVLKVYFLYSNRFLSSHRSPVDVHTNYYGIFGRILCTKRRFNIYQTKK